MQLLSTLDIVIFFGSLIAVMALGLWAGRKEEDSEDYYLAGKGTRWWGVAGSIFGSNVSANHLVGMMGVGFSLGFAQSHFEISAIAGLLMLCYGFLPMYRKLNVYTLSEYLSLRYNDVSRLAYAVIMIAVIVVIQMVPGFYIGSRSLNILLRDGATASAKAVVNAQGEIESVVRVSGGSNYAANPTVQIAPSKEGADPADIATATAEVADGEVVRLTLTSGGRGYDPDNPPTVAIVGGASFGESLSPGDVNPTWYRYGILLMALVTGTYTILGGLKAVIVTDVIQSVLMLIAGLILAFIVFSQPEVGGWAGMLAQDAVGERRMHLYKPMNDPELPWTGVLSGLMVLHFYYWGANQFIVQRALSARDDREARFGIIAAGFFKLLIPFFSIGTGIAAWYYFQEKSEIVAPDAVFIVLLGKLVAPLGFGLVGIIAAGMIGAILSSIDSMLNSAATIITFDVYKRYMNPSATEQQLIWMGRVCIVTFLIGAAALTIFTADPNSKSNFFLQIATHQSKLVAGVVVAFLLGMFWKRATGTGAIAAIIVGVAASYGLPPLYARFLSSNEAVTKLFGQQLNFMHSVFGAAILSLIVHVSLSCLTRADAEKSSYTWDGQGAISAATLRRFLQTFAVSLLFYALLATSMVYLEFSPTLAAILGGGWTWVAFILAARGNRSEPGERRPLLTDDRFWAGLLAGLAIAMMYYFY